MRDLEQVPALSGVAERDLSALRAMGENPDFADEIFGFHIQQAAEKSFKAWSALLDEDYPATHDLIRLLRMLMQRDTDAARFKPLADYGPCAVQFRYCGLSEDKRRETEIVPLKTENRQKGNQKPQER